MPNGNIRALRAVLAKIDKDPAIEAIFCLGDLICIGLETNEVLEILLNASEKTPRWV